MLFNNHNKFVWFVLTVTFPVVMNAI